MVQVMGASRDSIGSAGPDGPVVRERTIKTPFESLSFDFVPPRDFGCPSTTRVRVRALDSQPAGKVSGSIRFDYSPPGTVKLKMAGSDTLSLSGDVPPASHLKTRDLLPDPQGIQVFEAGIFGTGKFRIRAKWHVDPLATFGLSAYRVLTVRLLRPDGTTAAKESGFSQHVPLDVIQNYPVFEEEDLSDPIFQSYRRRIDFTYRVRPGDIRNIDQTVDFWQVRVGGVRPLDSGYPVVGSWHPIIDFDIDSGVDPAFLGRPGISSTFKAGCEDGNA